MPEEKKPRVHEGRVQGYLPQNLKKKLADYIEVRNCSESEVVGIAVRKFLEDEKIIPKKNS